MEPFGETLKQMRLAHKISLNKAAKAAGISAPYLSDIEKGRKSAPPRETLMRIIRAIGLDKEEEILLCEIAGKDQNTIALDLPEYIMDRNYVTVALRKAKELDAGEDIWKKFVDELLAREGMADESNH